MGRGRGISSRLYTTEKPTTVLVSISAPPHGVRSDARRSAVPGDMQGGVEPSAGAPPTSGERHLTPSTENNRVAPSGWAQL